MADFDKNIIAKYITGQCSDEELAQLLDWVRLSADNARELADTEQVYLALKAASMTGNVVDCAYERVRHHLHDEVKNESRAISIVRRWRYLGLVLLLMGAVGVLWLLGGKDGGRVAQQYSYVTAPLQGVSRVVLPDGSRVWLNAGARLRYLRGFADSVRKVDLRGEAYFEMAYNAQRPFMVRSNVLVAKGNGVAFNFCNDRRLNRADVSLVDGTLAVWCRNTPGMVTLLAGQKAGLDRNTGQFTVMPTDARVDAVWHNDFIPLRSVGLEKLAQILSRIYKVNVKVEPPVDAGITYSGLLPRKNSIRAVLSVIQEKLPVTSREECDTFYITMARR